MNIANKMIFGVSEIMKNHEKGKGEKIGTSNKNDKVLHYIYD